MDTNKIPKLNLGKISLFMFHLADYLLAYFQVSGANLEDEPYPSLSDYHDYEPNLEFDDTELHQSPDIAQSSESNFLSKLQSCFKY